MDRLYSFLLLVMLLLTACGAAPTPMLPTAYVVRSNTTAAVRSLPIRPPTKAPEPTQPPFPTTTPALDTPLDQYRAWMQEARVLHPYNESIEVMWEVMLCESSGMADIVAGSYYGLFQYEQTTWAGDWNPYRTSPILDPRAQIFATAKAWQDGSQHWWGCYTG
jgi:hypothetical protein